MEESECHLTKEMEWKRSDHCRLPGCQTFLREEFEANGEVYIATEDGSVGTKGNVMDAIREAALEAEIIYACGMAPMLRAKSICSRKSD